MSESQHCRAGEDLPHQCFMIADQSQGAGRHECSEKRFDSYDTSQLLEDSSEIKTFSSKADRGSRNQPTQDAEFGELDRKSKRLHSSQDCTQRIPTSA